MPVARINVLRVVPLLVVVGLVGDVNDLVEQARAEIRVVRRLLGRLVGLHLSAAHNALLHYAFCCLLHRLEHLFLLLLGELLIKLTAALVLTLTELAVLCDDLLALVGAPYLIIELLLLVALVLNQFYDHRLSLLELQLFHHLFLLADQAPSALLTLLAGGFSERFLRALLQAGAFEGECARLGRHGHAHGALAHRGSGPHRARPQPRLSTLHVETVGDGPLRIILGNTRVDAIRLQGGLERVDTVGDLIFGILELLLSYFVESLSLLEVELQLFALTVALPLLVLLPVLDTLLVPFLHETRVALEFVDLDTAHLLLAHSGDLLVFVVKAGGLAGLTVLFLLKLLEMRLHV